MEEFVFLVYDGSMKTIQTKQLHKYPALRMYKLPANEYKDLLFDLEELYPKRELIVVKHQIENECELGRVVSAKIVNTKRHARLSNTSIALIVLASVVTFAFAIVAFSYLFHSNTPDTQPAAEVIQND